MGREGGREEGREERSVSELGDLIDSTL